MKACIVITLIALLTCTDCDAQRRKGSKRTAPNGQHVSIPLAWKANLFSVAFYDYMGYYDPAYGVDVGSVVIIKMYIRRFFRDRVNYKLTTY
jgi:hypothetical protein